MDHAANIPLERRRTEPGPARGPAGAVVASTSGRQRRPAGTPATGRIPALLQTAAALIWLPQAACLSHAVGAIAAGGGVPSALIPACLVLALGVLKAGLDAAGGRLAFLSARAVLSEKRGEAAMALAGRSPLDTARPASGLAASVLAEQAEMIVPYLARFQPARLKATLVPLAILVCILPLSWVAMLILMVTGPLIPVFMALIGWRAKAASEKQLAQTGGLNAFLLDRLRGLATIRALGAVDRTALRLREEADGLRQRTMAVLRIAFLSSAVLELFAAIGVAMTAVYIGFHLLGQIGFGTWGDRLSLGEGLFVLLLAPAFFEPLRELSAVWHDRASGEAGGEALARLAQTGMPLQGGGDLAASHRAAAAPAVEIDDLRFTHAGRGDPAIRDLSLRIAPGEHVAIVGPSGSGKSTLLALVTGLAGAEHGRIAVGGTPMTAQTADAIRARMAWIGQRPHIFAGSIAANITLGRPGIGSHNVETAMRLAAFDTVAAGHGTGPLGEGGVGLSGGEVLRLALARAAADPHADLVLADEPTAHLDRRTAADITEGLLALGRGRTMIVATHDPVLAARMDRIIDLSTLQAGARR